MVLTMFFLGLLWVTLSVILSSYTDKTRQSLMEYTERMIEADIQDWDRDQLPDADVRGRYHTAVAVLLFQMLDQNVSCMCT